MCLRATLGTVSYRDAHELEKIARHRHESIMVLVKQMGGMVEPFHHHATLSQFLLPLSQNNVAIYNIIAAYDHTIAVQSVREFSYE